MFRIKVLSKGESTKIGFEMKTAAVLNSLQENSTT